MWRTPEIYRRILGLQILCIFLILILQPQTSFRAPKMVTLKKVTASSAKAAIRKSHSANMPPPILTHYTDLAGLKGIIEQKELWLSHAAFLNDPQELEHGVEQTKKVLKGLLDYKPSDQTAKARQKLVKEIFSDMESFERPNTYISCFCERADLLSQWRGYASQQGVSISFELESLRNFFDNSDVELIQVLYGIKEAKRHIKAEISKTIPDIVDDFEYMLSLDGNEEIRSKFIYLIATLIPTFKHYGFREEKEWRLIVRNPPISSVQFRPKGQLMLPYVQLKSKKKRWPITAVTIGPGVKDEAVQKSIQLFLDSRGYSRDLVKISSTPYRT